MSKEHPNSPPDEFGFTERERLFDRISHARLLEFLDDSATTIHKVEESYNNYGSFLFVTVSKPGKDRRILVTFWGMGYHEQRERWLTEEWFWYLANPFPETFNQTISRENAKQTIQQHRDEITPQAQEKMQSKRGQMFETIADLTDEDGAMIEIDELPWWLLEDDTDEL